MGWGGLWKKGLVLLAKTPVQLQLNLNLVGCTNLNSQNRISTAKIKAQTANIDIFTIVCFYIIFTSPIGGANKKGDALQKICNASPICDNAYL